MRTKKYESPDIVNIIIDNAISLQLESAPPLGPEEAINDKLNPYDMNRSVFG